VIEAVFEDRESRPRRRQGAEAAGAGRGVRLQHLDAADHRPGETAKDPAEIHRHPFLLAGRAMMLVEIIIGKKTGDEALAMALDYVRAIKKTPIVVNDSRGFYTSRCVGTYIREGHLMLMEGVPAAMIENLGRMTGMPVGPLSMNDDVAVDLAWKIAKATEIDLGDKDAIPARKRSSSDGGEAWPARPQERQGLLRLSGEGPEEPVAGLPTCSRPRSIPTPSMSRTEASACW
jgi:3-hydroxyacyl-CoA dehydrogenase / enoyl-CoA hydratase / 3-hydroxybutyryl-CoA epimerase